MKIPPPPPGPKNRDIRGREYNPNPGTVVFMIGLAMFIGLVLMLSGCERVKEYRCTAEQVEAMQPQLNLCLQIAQLDYLKRGQCYETAQAAHCELIADFHRTEIYKTEN